MTTTEENMKLKAQETLDELFLEGLLPFKFSARVIDYLGLEEYIVRFHDNRLRSVDVTWRTGLPFKDIFRRAVLDRVSRLGGPLRMKAMPLNTCTTSCHSEP
jgi:hypothetical protein